MYFQNIYQYSKRKFNVKQVISQQENEVLFQQMWLRLCGLVSLPDPGLEVIHGPNAILCITVSTVDMQSCTNIV